MKGSPPGSCIGETFGSGAALFQGVTEGWCGVVEVLCWTPDWLLLSSVWTNHWDDCHWDDWVSHSLYLWHLQWEITPFPVHWYYFCGTLLLMDHRIPDHRYVNYLNHPPRACDSWCSISLGSGREQQSRAPSLSTVSLFLKQEIDLCFKPGNQN